jgi:hypothetical protein
MVSVISNPFREAFGFGAKVSFPEDAFPYCREHFIEELSDIKSFHYFGL